MNPLTLKKLKINKPRQKVLFVDDDPEVHAHALRVSKRLGLQKRTAYNPKQASKKIQLRLRAINRLMEILSKKRELAKTSLQKALFTDRIKSLRELQKNPFALVVSDIHMPKGQPTGPGFVRSLRNSLPNQKILMHSDDYLKLEDLEREGFNISEKNDLPNGRDELREGIENSLKSKKNPLRR